MWRRVVATVEPLNAGSPSFAEAAPPPAAKPTTHGNVGPSVALPLPPGASESLARQQAGTLDGSWDRKLAKGLAQPDITIDLHGHTLDSAYRTLDEGLAQAVARGARVLLLVTGRPRPQGSGRGSIRAAVRDWLSASRHAHEIAAIRGAHPSHGGLGALYIIFKRKRPATNS